MEGKFDEGHKCPVCLEIPVAEIYQCRNGHSLCEQCTRRLRACPQCRVRFDFGLVRNRGLEDLLDRMTFECAFKEEGCTDKVKRKDISRHSEICEFGENVLNFCELLGYKCGFTMSIKRISEAVNHFLETHHLAICHDTEIDIRLEGFCQTDTTQKSMWYPVVLDLERQVGAKLMLLSLYNDNDQSVSFVSILLSGPTNEENTFNEFWTEFWIKSSKPAEASDLLWRVMPVPIKRCGHAISNRLYKFPIDLLSKIYAKDGTLLLRCSVEKQNTSIGSLLHNPATLCTFNVPIGTGAVKPFHNERVLHISGSTQMRFQCDSCTTTVTAVPYRCLQCVNYHTCQACMNKGEHGQHIFAKFRSIRHEYKIGETLNWSWASVLPFPLQLGDSQKEYTTKCAKCKVAFINYMCLKCEPGFGFCENCFGEYPADHDKDHFYALTKTERRLRLVLQNHPMQK